MMNFAPVIIPTLSRYGHFKNCVESLRLCKYSNNTDLFIFLDYPSKESHWDGYENIKKYLPTIKGFKSINIIERKRNFGVVDNCFKSVEYVLERSDRFIFSEDDNVFSPDFLNYMNSGLEIFKDRSDIFSINGYHYPIKLPKFYKSDTYISQAFNAWGFGIWKNKWEEIDWSIDNLKLFLSKKENTKKLNNKRYVFSLKKIVSSKNILGDIFIGYHLQKNNMYCVFPVISKVKNFGLDGSGVHATKSNYLSAKYLNQKISDGSSSCFFDINILPDPVVIKRINKYFRPSFFKILSNNRHLLNWAFIKEKIKKWFSFNNYE